MSGGNLPRSKKLLIIQEMLSSPKIKTPVFKGEPRMAFHHWFCSCFHFSPLIFTTVFRLLSLLIAFFYVTNVLCHDCFFATFLSGTSFWCYCAVSTTDLRKLFFLSEVFYLTLLSHIYHSTTSTTDLRGLF